MTPQTDFATFDTPYGIPVRPQRATLVTGQGERLGRFSLCTEQGARSHAWEWLRSRWPDQRFFMLPDNDELEPSPGLALRFHLPAVIERPRYGQRVESSATERLYDVWRIDGERRHLAVLVVSPNGLSWWEARSGGVLELAPGWLMFEPRTAPIADSHFDRCLVQPRRARG